MSIINCVECGKDCDDSLELTNPLPDNCCFVCGNELTSDEMETIRQNTNLSAIAEPESLDELTRPIAAMMDE